MKRSSGLVILLLSLFAIQLLGSTGAVYSETIYTIDGGVIEAEVSEKTEDTIWYEITTGDVIEEIGIDISDVDKILNDDGSVSEYSPIKTGA